MLVGWLAFEAVLDVVDVHVDGEAGLIAEEPDGVEADLAAEDAIAVEPGVPFSGIIQFPFNIGPLVGVEADFVRAFGAIGVIHGDSHLHATAGSQYPEAYASAGFVEFGVVAAGA